MARVVVQLRCDEDEKRRWVEFAEREGVSLSVLVRRGLGVLAQQVSADRRFAADVRQSNVALRAAGEESVAPVASVSSSVVRKSSLPVCAKTGFPTEVCLCPTCKSSR